MLMSAFYGSRKVTEGQLPLSQDRGSAITTKVAIVDAFSLLHELDVDAHSRSYS